MKKLIKDLDKFDKTFQIKLSGWQRRVLYEFITKKIKEIRDGKMSDIGTRRV